MENLNIQSPNLQSLSVVYSSPKEEWTLTNALARGDQRAYQRLYAIYGKTLLLKIKAIVKCQDVAEDLLQDTFVKFYRHIGCFNANKGLLFAWLSCLAKHTAIDYQRSKVYRNQTETCDLEGQLETIEQQGYAVLNTDKIGLRELLLTLTATQQRIINLIYLQGYSYSEAAKYLDIPIGTVKSRSRRAIEIMRQYFY